MPTFPTFRPGQTLTSHDLEALREFIDAQDRAIGHAVGFGVSCGLDITVDGGTVHVSPGVAIDQVGHVLTLRDRADDGDGHGDNQPTHRSMADGTDPDTAYDFLDPTADGFTLVLEQSDTVLEDERPCDQAGCEAHSGQISRAGRLRIAAGRLRPQATFANEPLLQAEPLRVRKNSRVSGPFIALRNSISKRIGGELSFEARQFLSRLAIRGDEPAIAAYKAGFLNQLLFAALDYLRCETLMRPPCFRDTDTPGVALGHLRREAGGGWVYDCAHRHHWVPPTGLSFALLGGVCEDPCALYLDRIEGMIATFDPPRIPPPPNPPDPGATDPGDWIICPPKSPDWRALEFRRVSVGLHCPWIEVPPEIIGPDWVDRWRRAELDLNFDPLWDPAEVYRVDRTDYMDAGTLPLDQALGKDAHGVRGALDQVVTEAGLKADVRVINPGEEEKLDGYAPASAVSAADTLVLTADAQGKVVATGRIPASRAVKQAGTRLPGIDADVAAARDNAQQAIAATGSFSQQLNDTGARIDSVEAGQADLLVWQAGIDDNLSGIQAVVNEQVQIAFNQPNFKVLVQDAVGLRMAVERDTALVESMSAMAEAIGAGVGDNPGLVPALRRLDESVVVARDRLDSDAPLAGKTVRSTLTALRDVGREVEMEPAVRARFDAAVERGLRF